MDTEFDTHHLVDSLFGEDIICYVYGLYSALYSLEKGFPENIGISVISSVGQTATFYSNELPVLSEKTRNTISKSMLKISVKGLLNNVYEKIKSINKLDHSDIMEFLRHIRNAASHGNKFNIKSGGIVDSAKWRDKIISYDLNGKDLFSFLSIGDFIYLINDLDGYINISSPEILINKD